MIRRWHRRYFKVREGELFYYDDDKSDRASGFIRLRGSDISYKGGNLLEIFDPRKKTTMTLRASSTQELEDWKAALDDEANTFPGGSSAATTDGAGQGTDGHLALIFDIGSCSARAGFADPRGTAWPSIYMPACVAKPREGTGKMRCGMDALMPAVRTKSSIQFPLRSATNFSDSMDADALEVLYGDLFQRLEVESTERPLIVTEPQFTSDRERAKIAEVLFETYNVPALYMKHQALLSMYSYNATTGVIVDIGDRLDIIPLDSGYVIEKGVTKMRLGGGFISESLTRMMSEAGHRFFSPVEHYVGRYVKERLAYVARDYYQSAQDDDKGLIDAGHVDVRRFALPDGTKTFSLAGQRFRCAEGLFQPVLWGKDVPGLHDLVYNAIMSSPIDMRKALSRNIYLAGGGSLLPGLPERLTNELKHLLPSSVQVTVHAHPHRQHAALQGASILASLPNFGDLCVWHEDWMEAGPDVLRKWHEETLATDMDSDDDSDMGDGRPMPAGVAGARRVVVEEGSSDSEADSEDEAPATSATKPTAVHQEEDDDDSDEDEPSTIPADEAEELI
ncbi:uncharacterized protein MONBRDRAFT_17728 [Monosiga brevicollis MX1]|uniref:PH domain-containing protein n=1 Tax=Monosiga brevicollis TaxID=81824 RepID=A9UR70_MONBE|nr:uncharacterized protein MONBRDRAFT_17728 [Monosiga brevicollis MX1]EDQ92194.1 predicted protein [Monosiga brevicollis MX1]|eukprot:XP_001743480.1 hypothetical protein [Monosiga brevicollis MX1]